MYNNYHTHTNLCDGNNSPEEMVKAAIAAGCGELGFSGHSYLPFDSEWTMSPEAAAEYRRCVLSLKSEYEDKIDILLGIEQDACSDTSELPLYDYVIGAVHCIFKDGNYIPVDLSAEALISGINKFYGGDRAAFAEDYFAEVGNIYEKTGCDIIAHFDLIDKFGLFDVSDERYKLAERAALEKLIKTPAVFEINTGAVSRGYMTVPYPKSQVLEILAEAGKPVIFSSDAHDTDSLLFGFKSAEKLAKKYGLKILRSIKSSEML